MEKITKYLYEGKYYYGTKGVDNLINTLQKENEELRDQLDSSNRSFNQLSIEALNIAAKEIEKNTKLKERIKELEKDAKIMAAYILKD
jgi:TolA-binding protein